MLEISEFTNSALSFFDVVTLGKEGMKGKLKCLGENRGDGVGKQGRWHERKGEFKALRKESKALSLVLIELKCFLDCLTIPFSYSFSFRPSVLFLSVATLFCCYCIASVRRVLPQFISSDVVKFFSRLLLL